jgi:hypothetical protein
LVPHLPHWLGSFCKSRQLPLQSVSPASHRHLPPPQVSNNASHAMLHWPQWLVVVCVSTQVPPQLLRPPVHSQTPALQTFLGSPQFWSVVQATQVLDATSQYGF